jgi:hypothetical protein
VQPEAVEKGGGLSRELAVAILQVKKSNMSLDSGSCHIQLSSGCFWHQPYQSAYVI